MSFDRIDPADLAALTPEERVAVEDLVLEAAVRRDRARSRRPEFPPEVEKHLREQAAACVKAILGDPPRPLSREEEEALRDCQRRMGRGILEREAEEAGPSPALAPKDDDA